MGTWVLSGGSLGCRRIASKSRPAYSIFSCSGGGWSTRMPQEMSGMGSASSRDTHNTDCSFPAGGRNPTFCRGERVCHGGPGCLPALPPLPRVGGGQLSQCWTFTRPGGTARIPAAGLASHVLTGHSPTRASALTWGAGPAQNPLLLAWGLLTLTRLGGRLGVENCTTMRSWSIVSSFQLPPGPPEECRCY